VCSTTQASGPRPVPIGLEFAPRHSGQHWDTLSTQIMQIFVFIKEKSIPCAQITPKKNIPFPSLVYGKSEATVEQVRLISNQQNLSFFHFYRSIAEKETGNYLCSGFNVH
jgi:hypothetical protein